MASITTLPTLADIQQVVNQIAARFRPREVMLSR